VHPRGFSFHDVNLPDVPEWTGLFAHWNRGANLAVDFDRWFLRFLPPQRAVPLRVGRSDPELHPSIATMGIGVLAGEMLLSGRRFRKAQDALRWGAGLLAAGVAFGLTLCPLVKEIWTPSWVLFTGGNHPSSCSPRSSGLWSSVDGRRRSSRSSSSA
jgi:hypothetical protein